MLIITTSDGNPRHSKDDHMGASKEASIYDSNRPFVDIVSRDEDLSARQQTSLTGFTAGRSLPGQALRTFLVIWMAALVLVFCQFYFLRAPEKAAVRSRSCIIQYIHNLDGKKTDPHSHRIPVHMHCRAYVHRSVSRA